MLENSCHGNLSLLSCAKEDTSQTWTSLGTHRASKSSHRQGGWCSCPHGTGWALQSHHKEPQSQVTLPGSHCTCKVIQVTVQIRVLQHMVYCRMWFLRSFTSTGTFKNLCLRFTLLNPVFSQGLHRRYIWDFLGTLGCWSVRLHTQSKNSAAPFTPVTQISLHGGGQQWGVWEWHAPNTHLGIGSGCRIKQTGSQKSSSICADPSSTAAPTED